MSTTIMAPEEVLERATALAKSYRNLDIMERTAILHGYLELTKLDPDNVAYRKHVDDAVANLVQAASESFVL